MRFAITEAYVRFALAVWGIFLTAIAASHWLGGTRSPNALLGWRSYRDGSATISIHDVTTRQFVSVRGSLETVFTWTPRSNALDNQLVDTGQSARAVSADGRTAWVSNHEGNDEIYVMDMNGNAVNVSNHPAYDGAPAWSPDGRLAWVSFRDHNSEIYVLDLESGELINVSQNPRDDYAPTWSPDGLLAWESFRDGNWEIYLLDITSGDLINVSKQPGQDSDPVWLPAW